MDFLSCGLEAKADANKVASLLSIQRSADGFFMEAHPKLRPVATDEVYKKRLAALGLTEGSKFKMSYNMLKKFYRKAWSDKKIADYHKKSYNIKIDPETVRYHAIKWKIQKNSTNEAIYNTCIILLNEGWTLERIYTEEFGYKYDSCSAKDRYHLKKKFTEWFANDPSVGNNPNMLKRIKKLYGKKS